MAEKNEPTVSDREIVSTRTFAVPREQVFRHLAIPSSWRIGGARTASPTRSTSSIFAPDGVWRLTMHGPDGIDYHNESVFLEVVPPERVVYLHLLPMHEFQMTMDFAEQDSQTTSDVADAVRFRGGLRADSESFIVRRQRTEFRSARGASGNDAQPEITESEMSDSISSSTCQEHGRSGNGADQSRRRRAARAGVEGVDGA